MKARPTSAQEIFELQGYLVVSMVRGDGCIGQTFPRAYGAQDIGDAEGPMIVVEPASFADWTAQHAVCGLSLPEPGGDFEFWKVVAE
jgi:hypothetical protein